MNPAEYKELRQKVGTQEAVADLLGVTRQLISAREKNAARITEEAAIALRELTRTTKKPRR